MFTFVTEFYFWRWQVRNNHLVARLKQEQPFLCAVKTVKRSINFSRRAFFFFFSWHTKKLLISWAKQYLSHKVSHPKENKKIKFDSSLSFVLFFLIIALSRSHKGILFYLFPWLNKQNKLDRQKQIQHGLNLSLLLLLWNNKRNNYRSS